MAMDLGVPHNGGIPWHAEKLLDSQEGLCFIEMGLAALLIILKLGSSKSETSAGDSCN